MKVLIFSNSKGGCGKTASTLDISYVFASKHKKRVLMIDLDSQCNLSEAIGLQPNMNKNIYRVLMGDLTPSDAIQHTEYENLDIISGSRKLLPQYFTDQDDKLLLLEVFKILGPDSYDYVMIDTSPSSGALQQMAFLAADYVVAVTEPSRDSRQGIIQMSSDLKQMDENEKKFHAKVLGILLCDASKTTETEFNKEELDKIAPIMNTTRFKTCVRHNVSVTECREFHQPVNAYKRSCSASTDYRNVAYEMLERLGDK